MNTSTGNNSNAPQPPSHSAVERAESTKIRIPVTVGDYNHNALHDRLAKAGITVECFQIYEEEIVLTFADAQQCELAKSKVDECQSAERAQPTPTPTPAAKRQDLLDAMKAAKPGTKAFQDAVFNALEVLL